MLCARHGGRTLHRVGSGATAISSNAPRLPARTSCERPQRSAPPVPARRPRRGLDRRLRHPRRLVGTGRRASSIAAASARRSNPAARPGRRRSVARPARRRVCAWLLAAAVASVLTRAVLFAAPSFQDATTDVVRSQRSLAPSLTPARPPTGLGLLRLGHGDLPLGWRDHTPVPSRCRRCRSWSMGTCPPGWSRRQGVGGREAAAARIAPVRIEKAQLDQADTGLHDGQREPGRALYAPVCAELPKRLGVIGDPRAPPWPTRARSQTLFNGPVIELLPLRVALGDAKGAAPGRSQGFGRVWVVK
jgi:hypothetical protein